MLGTNAIENDLVYTIQKGLETTKYIDQNGRAYASSSGYCERQTAFNLTFKGEIKQDASTTIYFEIGNTLESLVLNALENQGILMFRQFDIPDIGLNLGGRIDGIYRYPNDKIRLLEIKSCGKLPIKPFKEHIAQLSVYSAILGLESAFVYASRDVANYDGSLLMRQFNLDQTPDGLRETLFRVIYGKLCAERGVMPQIPLHIRRPTDCGFCKFKEICWDDKPSHLPEASLLDLEEIKVLTNQKLDVILNPDEINHRRNGVLKHMQTYGNDLTKNILNTNDWSDLV